MNLNRAAGLMTPIARTFILVNVALSALLLAAYVAGWRPAHSVAALSNTTPVLDSRTDSGPIDADAVTRAIRGKAIFSSYRVPENKAVDELGSRYRFKGALRTERNTKVFIKDSKEKRTLILEEGETFGGRYEIVEILDNGVRINYGGESVVLKR